MGIEELIVGKDFLGRSAPFDKPPCVINFCNNKNALKQYLWYFSPLNNMKL